MKVGVGGGRERLKKKGDLPRLSISEFKDSPTDLTVPLPRHFSPNCLLSTNGEKKIGRNRGKETLLKNISVSTTPVRRVFPLFSGKGK